MKGNKITFSSYLEEWYETYKEPKVRLVTQQAYRIAIKHINNDPIGSMEFKKISRKDMQEFFNRFGITRRKTTVLDFKGLINSCFVDAMHDGFIKINPVARIEIVSIESTWNPAQLREIREEKKWLEISEYKKFKMYVISLLNLSFQQSEKIPLDLKNNNKTAYKLNAKNYPTQMTLMVIYVAMKTGARFSEILGITKEDYDFENNSLFVEKTWDYRFLKTFTMTKNTSSIREIPLDKEFSIVLKNYLHWVDKYDIVLNQGALFVKDKEQVHNSVFNDLLRKIFDVLQIEPITLHKLRHTHASILIASGISLQVVAKRLGHADTNMIQRVYGHLLESVEEKENEKVLELI